MRNLVIGVLVVAIGLWFLWPSGPKLPPEEAVAAAITEMEEAVGRGRPKTIIKRLSKSFSSPEFDRQQAKAMIVMRMQRKGWSKIFVIDREIEAGDKTHVHVELKVVLARGGNVDSIADIAPDQAGAYGFSLDWEFEDDTWRIVRATYKRLNFRRLML